MSRVTAAACSVLLTFALTGCDDLLKQTAPSRVNAEGLKVPANAKLLVDGARAALGCALQAYITGGGLMTDELEDAQLAAAAWDYDRRTWTTVVGTASVNWSRFGGAPETRGGSVPREWNSATTERSPFAST